MHRNSLKCANCGNQDLEVDVNYCIPRAISLVCNKAGCGRITPIAFFDDKGMAYAINGEFTHEAYNKTFGGDVLASDARAAVEKDRVAQASVRNTKE